MSGKRFSLRDQARELADEIQVPLTALPSRVVEEESEEPQPESEEQGREVIEEQPVTDVPAPVEEPLSPQTQRPAIVRQRPNGKAATTAKPTQVTVNTIETLARQGPDLAPLSCRVPRKVRQELDRRVHELKGKGLKIKMEDVVTAALVLFLKIED